MMIMLESIVSLLFLLVFFSILGLGIVHLKNERNNFLLLPVFGYTTLITLSYFISANFKIPGATAVGWGVIILVGVLLLRAKKIYDLSEVVNNKQNVYLFLSAIVLPMITLILPGMLIGFDVFFGFMNFDFFYNSQDAWYLQSHHVLEFF